ncbi:glucokinase regulatory -like [Brachionus plicatilis]|uniref:Glucokinase regulatory-like n=1 Tax=Brachionus plicatilis TaxID=10195 RepID=A0A3M7S552_BRAPC|nr:glucokinase regulatory -like [Brachionus plicatilis]
MANSITENIDLCSNGEQILSLLSQTDEEIFSGSELSKEVKSDGIENDLSILNRIINLSVLIGDQVGLQLKNPNQRFKIILSGCGTSGRLAYLCSQTFSHYIKSKLKEINYDLCDSIIAGDEYALVNSVEAVEDKPNIGAEKLKNILDQHPNSVCVFIGITCGLSAPFVAGQIDHCLKDPRVVGFSLIGFNPVEMTRKTHAINKENENFYDLMKRIINLEEKKNFFLLNPIIGPEPITGSTRMKSGTATKIILDLILTKTIGNLFNEDISCQNLVNFYKKAKQCVYSDKVSAKIGDIIDKSADALRHLDNGGSINYFSSSERLGLLCCVDASECMPTYGSSKKDIKGFLEMSSFMDEQWTGFYKNCQSVWSTNITENLDDFKSDKSLFIFVQEKNHQSEIEKILADQTSCQMSKINLSKSKPNLSKRIQVLNFENLDQIFDQAEQNVGVYFKKCLEEFVLKLVLNAISTGAHVLYGKTYKNIMIDVRVSNIKLYWRAVGILEKFCHLTREDCERFLLKSIYKGVEAKNEIDDHVQCASPQQFVVPTALLMALTECDYSEAKKLLYESKNSIRNCIFTIKNSLEK